MPSIYTNGIKEHYKIFFLMPRKNCITEDILHSFKDLLQTVFTKEEISEFLFQNWESSKAPSEIDIERLIEELKRKKILHFAEIKPPNREAITIYLKSHPSIYEVAVALKRDAYISHQTAAYFHKLTDESSSMIYTTWEQSPKEKKDTLLEQETVDAAFSQDQKMSAAKFIYNDHTIVLLNGMYTGREGVCQITDDRRFAVTNIERTLIDVTVRPAYAGGALAVLNMYKRALKKKLSLEELIGILNTIPFIYPYHQSIGFYLQKAGYKGNFLNQLMKKEKRIDFYVDYNMEEKNYSKEWRVYYPAAMNC